MKICLTCKQPKHILEFSKDRSTKDGLKYYCKRCLKKYEQRPEVKARRKKNSKQYRQRPEVKAYFKEYGQRPERKIYFKEYNQRPEVKAYKKKYEQRLERKVYLKEYNQRPEVKKIAKRHIKQLSSCYVKKIIKATTGLNNDQINEEMIEEKRQIILFKRQLKKFRKEINYVISIRQKT